MQYGVSSKSGRWYVRGKWMTTTEALNEREIRFEEHQVARSQTHAQALADADPDLDVIQIR